MRHFGRSLISALALAGLLAATPASAQTLIRDAEIERTLRDMSAPIFQAAGFGRNDVEIFVIGDRRVNAFVANGANMFLNTGLILTLESPEELQAVIAHETGHIAGGHLARRAVNVRGARGPALLGILTGIAVAVAGSPEAGTAILTGTQSTTLRGLLKYNRGEEASADQAALRYLDRSGIDPQGLYDTFSRFRGQEVLTVGRQDPFVRTHPLSTERLQLIERALDAKAGKKFREQPERDYWHGRMQAKLRGFLGNPERILSRLEGEPESEEVLYTKATALFRIPDQAAALKAMDRLMALRPNDAFYTELRGQILFETGNAAAAVPFYREAIRLAPGQPLIEAGLGRALLALNKPDSDREALKVLQNARRHDLADSTGLHALAIAYARAGDEGMASLATAERFALTPRRSEDAEYHAGRAATILPEGSPGWLRAQDILSMKKTD